MSTELPMKYQVKCATYPTEIYLSGSITFQYYNVFRSVLAALTGPIGSQVVIDLSNVDSIDHEGLSMLIIAREVAFTRMLRLLIVGVRGKVREMVAMEGFGEVLPIAWSE